MTSTYPPVLDPEEQEIIMRRRMEKTQKEAEARQKAISAQSALESLAFGHRYPGPRDISSEEQTHAVALYARYGKSIRKIKMAPGGTVRGLGPHVLRVDPSTKMQFHDMFDASSPFPTTMMAPILSDSPLPADADQMLQDYVSKLPSNSPSLGTHYSLREGDSAPWPAYFPSSKAHVGVYTCPQGKSYIIASSHAGKGLAQDLSSIVQEPSMTAGGVADDPRVQWIYAVSRRNCARLIHGAACSMGVRVAHAADHLACRDGAAALPSFALACHSSTYNGLKRRKCGSVSIYRGCHHKGISRKVQSLTHGGHLHGYVTNYHKMGPMATCEHPFEIVPHPKMFSKYAGRRKCVKYLRESKRSKHWYSHKKFCGQGHTQYTPVFVVSS